MTFRVSIAAASGAYVKGSVSTIMSARDYASLFVDGRKMVRTLRRVYGKLSAQELLTVDEGLRLYLGLS